MKEENNNEEVAGNHEHQLGEPGEGLQIEAPGEGEMAVNGENRENQDDEVKVEAADESEMAVNGKNRENQDDEVKVEVTDEEGTMENSANHEDKTEVKNEMEVENTDNNKIKMELDDNFTHYQVARHSGQIRPFATT